MKITAMEGTRKKKKIRLAKFYAFQRLKKLPIFDKTHARNAMARFNQTEGMTRAERKTVKNKILRAARKFKVDIEAFRKVK